MARKISKRKVAKEQLALTVRKHVNALAVNETDVVVDFLYKVKNQGLFTGDLPDKTKGTGLTYCTDKSFKLRFAAPKQR